MVLLVYFPLCACPALPRPAGLCVPFSVPFSLSYFS
jgi:hypothetical protein